MVEAWLREEEDELPVPVEDFLRETKARIGEWNERGRAVCEAFLEVAARERDAQEGATRSTTSRAAEA